MFHKIFSKFILGTGICLVFSLFPACDIGLGSAVDTDAPTLTLDYPPNGAVIRGGFRLSGNWLDDQGVTSVTVTAKGVGDNSSFSYGPVPATLMGNSWSITMNSDGGNYNGFRFPDGDVSFTVTAFDGGGHATIASSQYTIDNTPPVFIASKPLTTGISENTTGYGRIFKITGDIYDLNQSSGIDVKIHLREALANPDGTYAIDFSKPEKVLDGYSVVSSMTDDNPLIIARYYSLSDAAGDPVKQRLRDAYIKIYGNECDNVDTSDKTGITDKYFFCGIELTDRAKSYSGGDGVDGNTSSVYYVNNTSVYNTLYSENAKNLNATKIARIHNGTINMNGQTYSGEDISYIEQELSKAGNSCPSSALDNERSSRFVINPDNSPKWSISGYEISASNSYASSDVHNYRECFTGGSLYLSITAGKDNTYAKPSSVTVKLKHYKNMGGSLVLQDDGKTLISQGEWTEDDAVTIGRQLAISTSLALVPGDYYCFDIKGEDRDGNEFVTDGGSDYGFKLGSATNPPLIKIDSTKGASYDRSWLVDDENYARGELTDADGILLRGDVEFDGATPREISVRITALENGTSQAVSPNVFIDAAWNQISGSKYRWSVPIRCTDFVRDVEGKFSCTATVTITDSNGKSSSSDLRFFVDTKRPVPGEVKASKTVLKNSERVLNGKVVFSTTAKDNLELSSVAYECWKIVSGTETKIDSGNCTEFDNPETPAIDTRNYCAADGTGKIRVKFILRDSVGNTSESSAEFGIDQETDRPEVEEINFDADVTADEVSAGKNLFGVDSNTKINFSVSDDDGIRKVSVRFREVGTESWMERTIFETGSNYPQSKAFSANVDASFADRKYEVILKVEDCLGETASSSVTKTYFGGVSSGAPSISIDAANQFCRSGSAVISGKVVSNTAVTLSGEINGSPAQAPVLAADRTFSHTVPVSGNSGDEVTVRCTVTDIFRQTASASTRFIIDDSAPVLSSASGKELKIANAVHDNATWYANPDLSVSGYFEEAGSGISAVKYRLLKSGDTEQQPENSWPAVKVGDRLYNFSGTLSGLNEGDSNSVEFWTSDAVGNESAHSFITIKMDKTRPSVSPKFYTVDGGATHSDATGTVFLNKKQNLVFYGLCGDAGSGMESVSFRIGNTALTPRIWFAEEDLSSLDDSSAGRSASLWSALTGTGTWTESSGGKISSGAKIWKAEIKASQISAGNLTITVSDRAANTTEAQSSSFSVITDSPSYQISSVMEGSSINGRKSISGTATGSCSLSAMELYYKASRTPLTLADKSYGDNVLGDITADGWKKIGGTLSEMQIYNWNFADFDFNSATGSDGFSAKTNGGVAEIYILPVIKDIAGNCSAYSIDFNESSEVTKYTWKFTKALHCTVDMNTDRPVVKVAGSISEKTVGADKKYILKYVQNAGLSGTVSDDDATSSSVVKAFAVAEKEVASAEYDEAFGRIHASYTDGTQEDFIFTQDTCRGSSFSGITTLRASSGEWEFIPKNPGDGTKKVWFIVMDNIKDDNGKHQAFITGSSVELSRPYFQFKSDEKTGSSAGFSYTSDSNPPGEMNLFLSKDGTDISVKTNSVVLGGTENNVVFRVSSDDANGIEGMAVVFKDANNRDMLRIATASSAGDQSFAGYRTDMTETFTKSESSIPGGNTWTLKKFDLSLLKTSDGSRYSGTVKVHVTAVDQCALSGSDTFQFELDNAGPSVRITSPSPAKEMTGAVVLSGSASDVGNSTVAAVEYMIPKKSDVAGKDESQIIALPGWSNKLASDSCISWQFNFNGTENPVLETYANSAYADETSGGSGVWLIPVLIRAKDALGNWSLTRGTVRFNPDADRPKAQILDPADNDVVGGSIRVSGIASDNEEVKTVFLQFDFGREGQNADKTGNGTVVWNNTWALDTFRAKLDSFNSTRPDESKRVKYAYHNLAVGDSADNQYTIYSQSAGNTADLINPAKLQNGWWGIRVQDDSWFKYINTKGEFNYMKADDDDKRTVSYVKIRACAVDNNGLPGAWSSETVLRIDTTSPYVSSVRLVKLASESNPGKQNASSVQGSQVYSSDMYVSGLWFLEAVLVDDTGVTEITITDGGTDVSDINPYLSETPADGRVNITLRYPVSKNTGTGNKTVKVKLIDKDMNSNIYTYSLNYDNEAPNVTDILDGSGRKVSMRKLRNKDRKLTFNSTATDTGSGFERTAVYFTRKAGATVELPLPEKSGGGWKSSSAARFVAPQNSLVQEDGLFGKRFSGAARSGSTTFTHSGVSGTDFIRAGSVTKIGGVYHKIRSVSGSTVTFEDDIDVGEDSAFFPAAIIVDNTSPETPSFSQGTCTISRDDSDGIIEEVTKSGSSWKWEVSLFSDELEDGEVTLNYVTFDKAGNSVKESTSFMLTNNTPRLAKVYVATDLDGDGNFSPAEFGTSTVSNSQVDYFSALSNGQTQAVVNLNKSASTDPADTGITMRDTLGVAFEFVSGLRNDGSGYEGEGSGNGSIYYNVQVGPSAKTEPVTAAAKSLESAEIRKSAKFSGTSASELKAVILEPGDFTGSAKYGSYAEQVSGGSEGRNVITLTLWDSTKGTVPGTGDAVSSGDVYSSFGSQWTMVNIPLRMDLVDDQDPVPGFNALAATSCESSGSVKLGHIETSASWIQAPGFTDSASGLRGDSHDKVSGKIRFTGFISDEKRMKTLSLKMTGATMGRSSGTQLSSFPVKFFEYGPSQRKLVSQNIDIDGVTFTIRNEKFSISGGHSAEFDLVIDTAKISTVAAKDVTYSVILSDGTNTVTRDYTVDVVPYITKIERSAGVAGGKTNRSKLGRYAVQEGETVTVSGFNFAANSSVQVGSNGSVANIGAVVSDGVARFTMSVPSKSGETKVTTNGVVSVNHMNRNADNMESTTMYDNRYLSVWALGNYFRNTDGGVELQEPVMTADKNGNLLASWVAQSNSNVMFSRGVSNANVTAIFRCYDQPSTQTGIAFDTKGNSGAASVAFIPEHQGSGGTFSSHAMSSSGIVGGAGAIGLPSYFVTGSTVYNSLGVNVASNPSNTMDGKNSTSYWQLASYDMNRRLGSFESPKAARYGNYLHNIWYDNVTNGLKYSVIESTDANKAKFDSNTPAIAGWVVIDGGFTGQDRVHSFTKGGANEAVANTALRSFTNVQPMPEKSFDSKGNDRTIAVAKYSTSLFVSAEGNAGDTSCVLSDTGNGLPRLGDTIALLQNDTGSYNISIRTITEVNGRYVKFDRAVNHPFKTATIYGGNLNVVGGRAIPDFRNYTVTGQSQDAGSSSAIDVRTDGKPVIAYVDTAGETLRVAVAGSAEPKLASDWTRHVVPNTSCSGEISMKVDSNNKIHILYANSEGSMCYVSSSDNGSSWTREEVIDSSGSYGALSVVETGTSWEPVVAYVNIAGTANGMKYAYRTSEGEWDYQILPSLNGRYNIKGGQLSLEARKTGWTGTETSVLTNGGTSSSPATVQAALAFKTKNGFDTAYLKRE